MKLWLMEILACPIDKHYPLELTILQWQGEKGDCFVSSSSSSEENQENNQTDKKQTNNTDTTTIDNISQLLDKYQQLKLFPQEIEKSTIKLEVTENGILIYDLLQIKPTEIKLYLEHLQNMIKELAVVRDISSWQGQKAIDLIRGEITTKILNHLDSLRSSSSNPETEKNFWNKFVSPIGNELEFLNQFKYNLEIQEGIIKCTKCNRWFPIFETIPQMLPDNVRPKDSDQKFMIRWQDQMKFPDTSSE